MTLLRRLRSAALAGGSIALVSPVAAQLSWDGANSLDAVFNGGGAGTWNNTTANWGNADLTANVAWSAGSAAVFGGTGGVVTVGEAVSASSLTFNANGYSLQVGPTNNVLTLNGTRTVTVASGVTAGITSNLLAAGTTPITKEGAGTIVLNGQSANSGGWIVNAGTVVAGSNSSFGPNTTAHAVTLNGATLDVRRDSGSFSIGFGLSVSGNSTLVNSRDSSGSGQSSGSVGGLSIGTATLNFSAGQNVTNNTSYGFRFGDGTGTDTTTITGNPTFNIANNGTGTGTLSFNSNASINGGATARTITKQGAGSLVFGGANGVLADGSAVNIDGGLLAARAANALGSAAAVSVASGARFEFGTSSGTGVANTIKSLSGAGTVLSANGASSAATNALTISSAITPGGAGIGTLTFNTNNPAGSVTVSFGDTMTLGFELGAAGASDQIRFLNYSAGELLFGASGNVINFTNTIGEAAAGQTYTLFTFFSDGVGATAVASGLSSGLTIGSGLEAFTGNVLNFGTNSITLTVGVIPEPGSFALIAGFAGLGLAATRRRRVGARG